MKSVLTEWVCLILHIFKGTGCVRGRHGSTLTCTCCRSVCRESSSGQHRNSSTWGDRCPSDTEDRQRHKELCLPSPVTAADECLGLRHSSHKTFLQLQHSQLVSLFWCRVKISGQMIVSLPSLLFRTSALISADDVTELKCLSSKLTIWNVTTNTKAAKLLNP